MDVHLRDRQGEMTSSKFREPIDFEVRELGKQKVQIDHKEKSETKIGKHKV